MPEAGFNEGVTRESLVGRASELAACLALLNVTSAGGAALLLRGDPGIGKSLLLSTVQEVARQRGFIVASTAGSEAEAGMAYAALHRLLLGVMHHDRDLAAHQRDALSAAFGGAAGAVVDVHLIAHAALGLLSAAAAQRPVLVTVDDIHWLDASSARVIGFIARRLEHDPIALVAAGRVEGEVRLDLPEAVVGPLDPAAATALLVARFPELPETVRGVVLSQADGNPLALLELPRVLRSPQITGREPIPELLPLTERLERTFASRIREQSAAGRMALLAAALAPGADVGELLTATSEVMGDPVHVTVYEPSLEQGLLEDDLPIVRFRHPLMRSAAFHGASAGERQAMHAALADTLTNPAHRLRHRAASVLTTDDTVAAQLDAAAADAVRRGSSAEAAEWLAEAVRLTSATAARIPRLLRAAELALGLGQRSDVLRLLSVVRGLRPEGADHARLRLLGIAVEDPVPADPAPARELVSLSGQMADAGDTDLALELLSAAALRCWAADPGAAVRRAIAAASQRMPVPEADPRVLAILAQATPIESADQVVQRLAGAPDETGSADGDRRLAIAAFVVDDHARAARLLDRAAARYRSEGHLTELARCLAMRAAVSKELGDWGIGEQAAEEAGRLAFDIGSQNELNYALLARIFFAGARGDADEEQRSAGIAESLMQSVGNTNYVGVLESSRGAAAALTGRHETAFDRLSAMLDPEGQHFNPRHTFPAIPYFGASAMRLDRQAEGHEVLTRLSQTIGDPAPPGLRRGLAMATPMLTNDAAEAERHFLAALQDPLLQGPFDHARMEVAYGTWLRRQRRVVESRPLLRAARDAFDRLGNIPFSDIARSELRGAGESSQRRHEAWYELTPQESQIARLAADGLTNREIGERLFLSHRTIASHLYRIFPKLGVASRAQLARVVPEGSLSD